MIPLRHRTQLIADVIPLFEPKRTFSHPNVHFYSFGRLSSIQYFADDVDNPFIMHRLTDEPNTTSYSVKKIFFGIQFLLAF
jgi:hypothetical protein